VTAAEQVSRIKGTLCRLPRRHKIIIIVIIIIIIIIIIIMFIDCKWVDNRWQWSFNMLHMHGLWTLII